MIIKDIYQEHLLNLRKFSLIIRTFSTASQLLHTYNYFEKRKKEKKITVSHGNLIYSLCGRQLSTSVNIYHDTRFISR